MEAFHGTYMNGHMILPKRSYVEATIGLPRKDIVTKLITKLH